MTWKNKTTRSRGKWSRLAHVCWEGGNGPLKELPGKWIRLYCYMAGCAMTTQLLCWVWHRSCWHMAGCTMTTHLLCWVWHRSCWHMAGCTMTTHLLCWVWHRSCWHMAGCTMTTHLLCWVWHRSCWHMAGCTMTTHLLCWVWHRSCWHMAGCTMTTHLLCWVWHRSCWHMAGCTMTTHLLCWVWHRSCWHMAGCTMTTHLLCWVWHRSCWHMAGCTMTTHLLCWVWHRSCWHMAGCTMTTHLLTMWLSVARIMLTHGRLHNDHTSTHNVVECGTDHVDTWQAAQWPHIYSQCGWVWHRSCWHMAGCTMTTHLLTMWLSVARIMLTHGRLHNDHTSTHNVVECGTDHVDTWQAAQWPHIYSQCGWVWHGSCWHMAGCTMTTHLLTMWLSVARIMLTHGRLHNDHTSTHNVVECGTDHVDTWQAAQWPHIYSQCGWVWHGSCWHMAGCTMTTHLLTMWLSVARIMLTHGRLHNDHTSTHNVVECGTDHVDTWQAAQWPHIYSQCGWVWHGSCWHMAGCTMTTHLLTMWLSVARIMLTHGRLHNDHTSTHNVVECGTDHVDTWQAAQWPHIYSQCGWVWHGSCWHMAGCTMTTHLLTMWLSVARIMLMQFM